MLDPVDATLREAVPRERIVKRPAAPLRTAVIGYGYWGPNLARNVAECPELTLEALCDRDSTQLERFSQRHPDARTTSELEAVLGDPAIGAVVLATPPKSRASARTPPPRPAPPPRSSAGWPPPTAAC